MTQEEFTKLVESLKAQGMEDEDILGTLLDMFKEGKVESGDLEKLAGSMGYEVTEEFKKLSSPEESKESPADAEEVKGEISEKEVEEAQEIPESRDEDKDEDEKDSEDEGEDKDDEDSDDSEEKDEARDLFGLKD